MRDSTAPPAPVIADHSAHQRFVDMATRLSLDPGHPWVGGYVDWEWQHSRYALELRQPANREVLEFGCNIGATAIVLAALGARVTAIDVDASYVALARLNAERYGLSDRIQFIHTPDTTRLPFAPASFDMVTAISVLEYVGARILPAVQQEIDRVLRPGGLILVMGTSNRVWPKEVHSDRWFINYLPRFVDSPARPRQRGVSPFQIRRGFGRYTNLDLQDGGEAYLKAKQRTTSSRRTLTALRVANTALNALGLSVGLVTPCISIALRKND